LPILVIGGRAVLLGILGLPNGKSAVSDQFGKVMPGDQNDIHENHPASLGL
jgi:hypothetical protein